MVFTVTVWAFSFLSLLIGAFFFVFFLWGWIPREDGSLSGYCERKINKRLMGIVSTKIDAAIADQERQRKRAELRAAKKAGELPPEERKATLPNLMQQSDEKSPGMPMLNRNDTMATLPVYTSRPGTPNGGGGQGFEMNKMPTLNRTGTSTSATSSRAPLLQSGAEMGRSSPAPPVPPLPAMNPPTGPPPLQRVQTNQSNFGAPYTQTPSTYSPENNFPPKPLPVRTPPSGSMGSYGMPPRSNMTPAPRGTFDDYDPTGRASPAPMRQMPSRPTFDDYNNGSNAASSAIPPSVYTQHAQPPRPMAPPYGQRGYPGGQGGYPMRNATGPLPNNGFPRMQPQRNMTAPLPQPGIQRQGTGEFRTLTPVQLGPLAAQPQRNMTPPLLQPGIQRQGTGEDFHSHTPVQQGQYGGTGQYYGPPAPSQAHGYPGPPPDEYLVRPSTSQSQRSKNDPPLQLSRQPTYSGEKVTNSPPQMSRRPTYGDDWLSDLEDQRGGINGPRY